MRVPPLIYLPFLKIISTKLALLQKNKEVLKKLEPDRLSWIRLYCDDLEMPGVRVESSCCFFSAHEQHFTFLLIFFIC